MCDNFEMVLFGSLTARIRKLTPHARFFTVVSTKRDSVQLLPRVHGLPAAEHGARYAVGVPRREGDGVPRRPHRAMHQRARTRH